MNTIQATPIIVYSIEVVAVCVAIILSVVALASIWWAISSWISDIEFKWYKHKDHLLELGRRKKFLDAQK